MGPVWEKTNVIDQYILATSHRHTLFKRVGETHQSALNFYF